MDKDAIASHAYGPSSLMPAARRRSFVLIHSSAADKPIDPTLRFSSEWKRVSRKSLLFMEQPARFKRCGEKRALCRNLCASG